MRRIIWMMSVSVDGYMAGPEGDLSWHRVDDELHRHLNDWIGQCGGILAGRVTYELMADFWPTADADPGASPTIREFAAIWRSLPKVVYSRTLTRVEWNASIVRDVVLTEVEELKAQDGGDLVLGGSILGAEFARRDLIDEYRLYVHPILIGRGRQALQPSDASVSLRHVESRTFGNGVAMLRYERQSAAGE